MNLDETSVRCNEILASVSFASPTSSCTKHVGTLWYIASSKAGFVRFHWHSAHKVSKKLDELWLNWAQKEKTASSVV